jgi:AmmeMemoRadiSam system protein B
MGRVPVDDVRQLGHALATLCAEYDVLIVASSDLSHYLPLREAEVLDHLALQAIGAVDAGGLLEVVARRRITMCGVLPVAAMLTAANELGVPEGKVLHYHTSGAITGENHEVVGYGAAALYHIR